MKKARTDEQDELRVEYQRGDLGKGRRGVAHEAFEAGTNLVLLRPDVAAAFPSAEAVDEALRGLMRLARRTVKSGAPLRSPDPVAGPGEQ